MVKYIYFTRQYHKNKCIDVNEIGIGETIKPLDRLKDHNNSSSSKCTIEIKFEEIYRVKENVSDRQLHKILLNRGFKRDPKKKEVFYGKSYGGSELTIEYLSDLFKDYFIEGPWTIENKTLVKKKTFKSLTTKNDRAYDDWANYSNLDLNLELRNRLRKLHDEEVRVRNNQRLDPLSRDVLEALGKFQGSILMSSHDQALIDKVATGVYEIVDAKFEMNLDPQIARIKDVDGQTASPGKYRSSRKASNSNGWVSIFDIKFLAWFVPCSIILSILVVYACGGPEAFIK